MRSISLLLAFLFSFTANAQTGQCGTSLEDLARISHRVQKRLEGIDQSLLTFDKSNTIKYVPITFHIVSAANGTGAISEADCFRTLCEVNKSFLPLNVQFYIKRFNYFSHDVTFQTPNTFVGTQKCKQQKKNDSMNIFVCNTANTDNGLGGVTLAYYSEGSNYDQDWIVIRKVSMRPTEYETLTHEIGHFLNLPHTFNGYECGPHCQGMAPAVSSCGAVPTELANGSNCATAGDFICDTGPDYNFGFCPNVGCPANYNPTATDPTGVALPAMSNPKNFMSYFISCASYKFSETQMVIMNDDLSKPQRAYLLSSYVPNTSLVTATPVLQSPAAGATTGYNYVHFEWAPVPNATSYLFEIDKSSAFSIAPKRFIVQTNHFTAIDILEPNSNYFWRVAGFNESGACGNVLSGGRNLKTDNTLSTEDPNRLAHWFISPNPVRSGQQLNVTLDAPRNFEAQIGLYSITGQQLQVLQQTFAPGRNIVSFPTDGIPQGSYFIMVDSELGQIRQQVVVVE